MAHQVAAINEYSPAPLYSFQHDTGRRKLDEPIKDYLTLSLFSVICCCWPLGIIALIKSFETRNYAESGRYIDAQISSKEAKMYNMIAIFIGIFASSVILVIVLFSFIPLLVVLY